MKSSLRKHENNVTLSTLKLAVEVIKVIIIIIIVIVIIIIINSYTTNDIKLKQSTNITI
jgi:uncharacterized integral membrane protein